MRPSQALALHLDEVRAIIAKYPVSNPRIFGSVARVEDRDDSDLDILVDADGPFSFFDMAELEGELASTLGCRVDLGLARSLRPPVAIRTAHKSRAL